MLFLALGLALSLPASAVFKCRTGDTVTYRDTPCDGGELLDLKTAPVSGDGEGERQAARDKKMLNNLERERHKHEAAEQRELKRASRESAVRHKKCAAHARRQRLAKEDAARAVGIANEKARRKVERITAEYEAECGRWYERELGFAK
ncbi:hypothetical protein [Noviherbaspirillum denitrificans]|uniref:hypothetical protein n=1 Tax=Noviherbaspirillum denitrificans TaxID=1968433 RepID=UPI00113295D9|nr:hypothetical protein [Noviherbaspirillum denitrificans]